MKKNTASQVIGVQMVSATDGSAFTGSVTVYVTGDAGTQALGSVGSGACTHEGNGFHTYAPAQAETNYDHVAFTFIGTGAVPATVQVYTTFPQTGDNYARLGAPAGASIAADIATVDTVVDGIQTDLSNGTDGLGAIKTAVDAVPTAAANADAVWDEATSGHVTAGTFGVAATDILADTNELQTDDVPGLIAALNDPTAAAIADAVWDEAIAGHAGVGSTGEALSNATAPTAAAVADAVWDEALSGHLGAGSTGEALNAAGAAGDPWTTALPGAYGAGSAGYIIGNNIDAPLSTIDTVVDGIQTDLSNATDGLGAIKTAVDAIPTSNPTAAAIADAVWDEATAGHVTAGTYGVATTDILADTNELQTDDIPTTLATLATAAALATVDSNVDAILVDTGTTLPASLTAIETDTQDIQSRLPAALVSGRMSSDVVALSGSTTAADNLEASALAIISGAAAGTPTTTVIESNLTGYTNDQLIGRVVIFTSGNAEGEATDITDYVETSGVLTVTALSTAPAASDTFIIV